MASKMGATATRHNHQRTVTPELGKVDCIVAKFIAQYLLGESPALVPVKFLQFGQLRDLTGINLSEDLLGEVFRACRARGNDQLEIPVGCSVLKQLKDL